MQDALHLKQARYICVCIPRSKKRMHDAPRLKQARYICACIPCSKSVCTTHFGVVTAKTSTLHMYVYLVLKASSRHTSPKTSTLHMYVYLVLKACSRHTSPKTSTLHMYVYLVLKACARRTLVPLRLKQAHYTCMYISF